MWLPISCFFANDYPTNILKFLIHESLSHKFFWTSNLSSPGIIACIFFVEKIKFHAFLKGYLTKLFRFVNSQKYIQQILWIFRFAKVSFAKFYPMKVFFGGLLTGEFIHFTVNYSDGLFLKMLFSRFRKQENLTWRNFILNIFSQTLRSFTNSPSSEVSIFLVWKSEATI